MKTSFKEELEQLRRAALWSKLTDHTRFEERWGVLAKVKVLPSAANTEKHVVEFLNLKGHQASKTEVKGTHIKGTDYKSGNFTIKGKDKFIKSGATKGQADISATVYGISVHFELKYSKYDRQSADQKKFEQSVSAAGGIYMIIYNVDDFYEKYYQLMEHPRIVLMKQFEQNGKGN